MTACGRCGGALEAGDLRCPLCGLAVEVAPVPREATALVRAKVVRCAACGASLAYSAEARAPRCAFCASVMHVEMTTDPMEQADAFLPFLVDEGEARRALGHFLGRKRFFRPSDLARLAAVESLQPVWWPAWSFSAEARVSWAADSDAGSGRADWAPHAGQEVLTFQDILVSASRGLSREECERLAGRYVFKSAKPAPHGPEDALQERFDVTRSGARRQILAAVEAEALKRVRTGFIPGKRSRNVHVAVVLSRLATRRYALPVHVLAYRYGDRVYRVVVHGQDRDVMLGTAPVSGFKVALVVFGALLLLGALFLLFQR